MAILVVNPRSDEAFAQLVRGLALQGGTPSDLESLLRAYYPDAVVRPRGLSGERETWYVYRDGIWVPSRPIGETTPDERAGG